MCYQDVEGGVVAAPIVTASSYQTIARTYNGIVATAPLVHAPLLAPAVHAAPLVAAPAVHAAPFVGVPAVHSAPLLAAPAVHPAPLVAAPAVLQHPYFSKYIV